MSAVTGSETQRAVVAPGVRPPLAVPRRILRLRSDAALAERFAAGDEAAFDVLYERHRPVVLAVAMGVLGTTQDAEDATQETFSALAVALQTKPPAELRPWLIRVARNASIDTTRRRRHRLLTLDGELPDVPARSASAGQAELAVVLDGIRELPEGQRMALLMRELGGHTYSEIAEFLETDEEAVKGLIARARVGLRTYREATDLPCATARAAIASEPDGRRHDKTIRRHLRSCASCRSYRGALRDDAKALRAALPLPAGSVATGGISTGMLTAAKGTLIGYGLTQAATTCAAAACGVGAIGGMVFVAPIHKLGLPPIIAPAKAAPAHKHVVAKVAPKHEAYRGAAGARVDARRRVRTVTPAVTASKPAVAGTPAVQPVDPPPPARDKRHESEAAAAAHSRDRLGANAGPQAADGSPQHATTAITPATVVPSAGNSGHGHGYGHQQQSTPTGPAVAASSPTQGATPTSGNGQSGSRHVEHQLARPGPARRRPPTPDNYGNRRPPASCTAAARAPQAAASAPTTVGPAGALGVELRPRPPRGRSDRRAGSTRRDGRARGHGHGWGGQSAAAGWSRPERGCRLGRPGQREP